MARICVTLDADFHSLLAITILCWQSAMSAARP